MPHSFHHAHIKSTDPRGTARFWADAFGAKPLPERTVMGAVFAPVELGGVVIMISNPAPVEVDATREGDSGLRYGLEHIGIATDDLARDLARLRALGLEVLAERELPGMRVAFVDTPDRVRVELIQPV